MQDGIQKLTTGYVVQTFDKDGKCTGQEFVAGDQVDYENKFGEPLMDGDDGFDADELEYMPMNMVQPESK